MIGRFAPSPSGSLHLGNLRTALIAWCCARSVGGRFLIRMEDLTTGAAPVAEAEQLEDLATIGVTFDGELVRQSERQDAHSEALHRLEAMGVTYPCFCTRREIREAAAAPHGADPAGPYPGTCARLNAAQRAERFAAGGRAATRLRAEAVEVAFSDRLNGDSMVAVDDFVLCRADGVVAYNLAVVVDDAGAGVDQVVRGDDLLETTQRQVYLQHLLGWPTPEYIHVPLVLGPTGDRLSKRDGAVGLRDQLALGAEPGQVLSLLARSFEPNAPDGELADIGGVLKHFEVEAIPRQPWILDPAELAWA